MTARPARLRAEHRDEALGIDVRRPRLSWRLPPDAIRQDAYELRRDDGHTSGRVGTDDNVLVPWPGPDLASGERREVSVRVWTGAGGPTEWSEPLAVEAGLLDPSDWRAGWISPDDGEDHPPGFRPAYRLRGELHLDRPVRRARLHVTAHGVYEAWLDGRRVGRDELTPGYTEYASRTQVQTYDVTDLLAAGGSAEGGHVLGAHLADGWFRGQVGLLRAADQWGDTTALLAQLQVELDDGSTVSWGTDADWSWAPSHVVAADLIEGQREDRRLVEPDWTSPSYDPGAAARPWRPVVTSDRGHAHLVGSPAPPVRAVEEIRPASVHRLRDGVHVIDLGQNVNGRLRVALPPQPDVTITLTHGEALGADGDVTMTHLQPAMPFLLAPLSAGQVDTVTTGGRAGDVFEPRFTTHGFRYVRVEGLAGSFTVDDVTGVVVHTDLEPRGGFSCSDERLCRLHDAAVWSFRGNACDIPTDCPTRERAGWTGDWQLYVPTASHLYDVAGFSLKWLRDLAVAQWPDGTIGNMAPMPAAERHGMLEKMNGSAGWGDAIVLVPWELHQEYGDPAVLAELWPAMVRWLDRVERMATTGRHPDRIARSAEPQAHERHLWDSGFHWGEWLEPGGEPDDFGAFVAADKAEVATAFYAWSTRHAAAIAHLLGDAAAATRYATLSDAVADAWRTEFVTADGQVRPRTQANLVRALRFGLVPDELRQRTADDLAALIREAGTTLGTGFLATPDLLPVLADHGHLDLAYQLLLADQVPSWLAMVDRGATTVWERWDGIDDDGVPHESLNHYSKGAVISFLHRYVAGLQRTSPTWRTFRVAPRGGGITQAHTWHDSPHGRIDVAWTQRDSLELSVTVPPGCTATVVLPDGTSYDGVGPGDHRFG